ncbi:hypothetical protein Tco_0537066 [Tanacetum coccineum]
MTEHKIFSLAFPSLLPLAFVALLFQAAGQKPDVRSLKAPQSATPTSHYDVSPEQLADMTCEHDFRFLLDAYWDTTLVILMVATAASLALGIKSEVLAITRGLHDVRKEASALHSSLMGDLSNVLNVEGMTKAIPTKKRAKAAEIFNDTKVAAQVPCKMSNVTHMCYNEVLFCAEMCCLDAVFVLKGVFKKARLCGAKASLRREAWPPRYEMDKLYSRSENADKDLGVLQPC